MRNAFPFFLMFAIVVPLVSLPGCDRTVSETTKEHSDSNGNVSKETKTVTEDPNGNVTVTKDKVEKKDDK